MVALGKREGSSAAVAYLSQFEDDIFVSYAHVDDATIAGPNQGWVTHLTKCLRTELARKLGRSDAYSMWVDHDLLHSHPLTPQILERVRRSAVLVVILSPGYIASNWCRQEREAFFGVARSMQNVFVIEIDHIEDADRPAQLADFSPFRFWTRGPREGAPRPFGWPQPQFDDQEYYGAVKDLAQAIAVELQRLKKTQTAAIATSHQQPPTPAAASSESGQNGAVYLAHVTDDLEFERNNVRRYLEQAGIRVVPSAWYSLEPTAFRTSAAADIAAADLFVQLLSGIMGKRPPDLPEGYGQCQLQLALEAAKPVLQWCNSQLDLASVEDDAHRALLERATVHAEPIEEFKQAIRRRLHEIRNPAQSRPATKAFIFVDMDSADRLLAENLCSILHTHGAGYVLPLETQDPGDYRRDLEDNLSSCDALMVIYGATTSNWVRSHLLACQKTLVNRPQPPRGLALLQGPPSPKDRLPPARLPNMEILDCQNGVSEAAIVKFLSSLNSAAT